MFAKNSYDNYHMNFTIYYVYLTVCIEELTLYTWFVFLIL